MKMDCAQIIGCTLVFGPMALVLVVIPFLAGCRPPVQCDFTKEFKKWEELHNL